MGLDGSAPTARMGDATDGAPRGTHLSLVGPSESSVDAKRLIFWLFVALAAASALAIWVFVNNLGDCDRDGVYDGDDARVECEQTAEDGSKVLSVYDGTRISLVAYRALAADLAAPVAAWFILAGIGSKGRPERWFWFAGALPAGLITMAAVLVALSLAGAL